MKLKLLLISFIFCLSAISQDTEELVRQAAELFTNEEYEKAIPVAEKAAKAIKELLGEDNMLYTTMMTVQASSFYKTYQYSKSEEIYSRLCQIVKTVMGEKDPGYSACLHNLATLYAEMGAFEKGEPILLLSRGKTKELFGINSIEYTVSLNNLAGLYQSMGRFEKAEPLYLEALILRRKIVGENHADYANSLNNLGSLYLEMGQYESAEPLFLQASSIRKKLLGEMHGDYASSLNNLASVYEDMEQYAKAESLYIRGTEIRRQALGETHPDYAASLNNLASMYTRMGQFKKAEGLMIRAKDIWLQRLGAKHPNYATALNNLGALYRKSGVEFDKSEAYYKQAIDLRKSILGELHPYYADTQNDLALLYFSMHQYAKAEPLLTATSQVVLSNMNNVFAILSEKEKSQHLHYNSYILESGNNLLYHFPGGSSSFAATSLNMHLGFKSTSLADTRNMLEAVRNSRDQETQRIFKTWQSSKVMLSKQYSLPVNSRLKSLSKIEEDTEALEKELIRRSAEFRQQQNALRISIPDVQKRLEPGEAALEFVRFRIYDKNWTDTIMYAAYVLQKNDPVPRFIPLCSENQLNDLSEKVGKSATGLAKVFYGSNVPDKANTAGANLYKLIWEPIEPALKGINKIAFSPAGKLYGIAFHALPIPEGKLLLDKYSLRQYVSIREVGLRSEQETTLPADVALFGDPDFSMDSLQLAKQRSKNAGSGFIAITRGVMPMGWPPLPGTAVEVNSISRLFLENKRATKVFLKSAASEANLKGLNDRSPVVMHIATHGFFLPDPGEEKSRQKQPAGYNVYKLAGDPLLRSGLILSGGNYIWSGKKALEGVEDGVVTAFEIAQLNLSRTSLVALSACETGLGDIKGIEGVFGLQRAFKMAGVKKILVSLWQVPDKETVELMTLFYTHWMKGGSIHESFSLAQGEMRKKYPPISWAAFVLVE